MYRNLDDKSIKDAAINDSYAFLKHAKELMIIDEVQRVQELILAVKMHVDNDKRPGCYFLTGSADIQFLPKVQESLAGRVAKIRHRGISQGEIYNNEPDFLGKAFSESFNLFYIDCSQSDVISRAQRGGYPEILEYSFAEKSEWYQDYIDSILARDIKEIININKHQKMQDLVKVIASWSGKFMDIAAISSTLSLNRMTKEKYIYALEMLYLCEKCRPWTKTDYEYVSKRDKIYFSDAAFMSSLLGWKGRDIFLQTDRLGKLIETFVFNELSTHIDAQEDLYALYQYRDKVKREIDFIIEDSQGNTLCIEVKSGSSINKKAFQHIQWFQKNLAKEKKCIGICLYTGEQTLSFGNNLWAVPMAALWS